MVGIRTLIYGLESFFSLVFIFLFTASWIKWHEYREENRMLKTVAAKHEITSVMLNELYPEAGCDCRCI